MSFEAFLRLMQRSYDQPKETARWVIGLNLPSQVALLVLAVTASVTTLVGHLAQAVVLAIYPQPEVDPATLDPINAAMKPLLDMLSAPIPFAGLQVVSMVLTALLLFRVGRVFGGTGTLRDTLSVMALFQVITAALQLVQVALTLALPFMLLPAALFVIFSYFFLLSHFTAALHGFRSAGAALGLVILVLVLLGIGFVILLSFFISVPHV